MSLAIYTSQHRDTAYKKFLHKDFCTLYVVHGADVVQKQTGRLVCRTWEHWAGVCNHVELRFFCISPALIVMYIIYIYFFNYDWKCFQDMKKENACMYENAGFVYSCPLGCLLFSLNLY